MGGFSIMAVKSEEGQSLIEFLLLLPMLVGLSVVLVRVNTAIQISIVNQQYARAEALFLSFNSPIYPELSKQARLVQLGTNELIIGVADNIADDSGNFKPKATVQLVARTKNVQASDEPMTEPPQRAQVRVRGTVTLCSPTLTVKSANGTSMPIQTALNEQTIFDFCGGIIKYE